MFKRKILFALLILVFVCAVSHVAAEDPANETLTADEQDTMGIEEEPIKEAIQTENVFQSNESGAGNTTVEPVVEKTPAKLKAAKATVGYKKGTKWTVKLTDDKNNPLAGKTITLKVFTGSKSKTVKIKTDSKGIASYNTKKLSTGKHKIQATFTDDAFDCKMLSSSIKVVKQTPLKIYAKPYAMKEGSVLSIVVMNKKTKKFLNGVKLKVKIYTGKKYKTITLKTRKLDGGSGVAGYATNALSAGKHKVTITPVLFKYDGSKTTKLVIKKSAKKYPTWSTKI